MKKIAGVVPAGILDQHVAILGKTRSGKSSVMRQMVEALLEAGKPVCIVDPKGDWWGIKLAADGKGPGYPLVIFGGDHADVPINEHAGGHVAELFATGNRSCLIDLGGWTVGARTRFWIEFASTLFKLTKGQRWLAVDEFHNFAPKGRVMDADAGKMLHWSNRLASEGLGKGLNLLFASQRPQKVHNDSLTSAETLIAMRVLHPSDRGAVSDWIKGCGDGSGDDVLNSLGQMERGEGWVWSPEIGFGPQRVKFPMFSTYDSFRPQTVEDTKRLKGWAEVDLDEVRAKLGKVVEEAKANDPRELKKQLASVRAELAKAQQVSAKTPAAGIIRAEKATPALTDTDRALIEKTGNALLTLRDAANTILAKADERLKSKVEAAVADYLDTVRGTALQVGEELTRHFDRASVQKLIQKLQALSVPALLPPGAVPGHNRSTTALRTPSPAPSRAPIASRTPSGPDSGLSGVEQRILNALAELELLGVLQPAREMVAFLAGYSHLNSKGLVNGLGALRTAGLIDYPTSGAVALTEEGQAAAQYPDAPRSASDVQNRVISLLGGASERILRPLIDAYPGAMTREAVAAAANYGHLNSKGFVNAISRLRSLGFIDYPDRGTVVAKPVLFLEAR